MPFLRPGLWGELSKWGEGGRDGRDYGGAVLEGRRGLVLSSSMEEIHGLGNQDLRRRGLAAPRGRGLLSLHAERGIGPNRRLLLAEKQRLIEKR